MWKDCQGTAFTKVVIRSRSFKVGSRGLVNFRNEEGWTAMFTLLAGETVAEGENAHHVAGWTRDSLSACSL